MSYYNNQGGYAPHGGQASKTKKEKINQWEGIGVIGSKVPNGDIKFYPFPNGGGVIHFNLACTEFTGMSDENGNPKTKTSYIPVSVFANKNITAQQLQAVTIGMKVRVVGKLANQSYEDKKTGQKRSSMAVEAYVFEILESPMQMQYGQPAYGQQPMAPQQYYPQQPYQQMPSQQQYQQQAPPQYQQPMAPPQYQQQMPPQQQYQQQAPPQYQAPVQQPQPQPQAPAQPQAPQYYQQPQAPAQPQGPQQAPPPTIDDMPDAL